MVVFGGNNKTSCFNTVHVFEAVDEERQPLVGLAAGAGANASGLKRLRAEEIIAQRDRVEEQAKSELPEEQADKVMAGTCVGSQR